MQLKNVPTLVVFISNESTNYINMIKILKIFLNNTAETIAWTSEKLKFLNYN